LDWVIRGNGIEIVLDLCYSKCAIPFYTVKEVNMSLVHGVDVSVYEPKVDWLALRAQGFKFAFIRATSSTGYVDPKFAEHWSGARAAGILRGAYHYLFGGQDARRQAELFIDTVGMDKGELPPIVDLEDAYNEDVPNRQLMQTCKVFLDIIEGTFGRKPMVYSRRTYLEPRVSIRGKAPSWAKDYDLWIAQYPFEFDPARMPNVNMPKQPKGWKDWKFWQYSETAIIDGVTNEFNQSTAIDLNWFRGTEAELYQFANVEPAEAQTYTVQEGDTFEGIAEKHGLKLTELLDANSSLLEVGSTLNIPGRTSVSAPTGGTGTGTSTGTPGGTTSGPTGTKTHTVQRGDTLFAIAQTYNTTVDAIMAINPQIVNRNIIFEGQEIKIP
jgi:lysozyme